MHQEALLSTTEALNETLLEIQRAFGRVPNLFQAYAKYPALLEANWHKIKAVLLTGSIRRKAKEVIALLISQDNGCEYCVAAHYAALKSLKVSEDNLNAILHAQKFPDLSDAEIALVEFARKVNLRWQQVEDPDFERLEQLGVSEAEIVEILGLVELFAGFNRFARAMRIPVDF